MSEETTRVEVGIKDGRVVLNLYGTSEVAPSYIAWSPKDARSVAAHLRRCAAIASGTKRQAGPLDSATPEQERILNGMMDGFNLVGIVEALDWIAVYFEDHAEVMAEHGHPVPWCDDLVSEVLALVAKYRTKARS